MDPGPSYSSLSNNSRRKNEHFRRNIRLLSDDALNHDAKEAQRAEMERLKRILSINNGTTVPGDVPASASSTMVQSASQRLFQQQRQTQLPDEDCDLVIIDEEGGTDLSNIDLSDCVFIEVSEDEDESHDDEPDEIEMEVCELRDSKNLPDEAGRIVINTNRGPDEETVQIAPHLVNLVKPHQVSGIKFLFENVVVEAGKHFHEHAGFGCILAHSMGLGKTIQVITFLDVLFRFTEAKTALCIVPINTLQNWVAEFHKWLPLEQEEESITVVKKSDDTGEDSYPANGIKNESSPSVAEETSNQSSDKVWVNQLRHRKRPFDLHVVRDIHKTMVSRHQVLTAWQRRGGVLILGYEMFRLLTLPRKIQPSASVPANLADESFPRPEEEEQQPVQGPSRKRKKSVKKSDSILEEDLAGEPLTDQLTMWQDFRRALIDPGPDVIICDEGHRIKNSEASISKALKAIRTKRRVVLTGYPIQNNLMEYWCMVDFVRPNYLGTKPEFTAMFIRPIDNGQCIDSNRTDKKIMQGRAHVLHELLAGFVQRRSHAVLKASLPEKCEVVLMVKMSPLQRRLYRAFMHSIQAMSQQGMTNPTWVGNNTLRTYAMCCKIWNHPDILWRVIEQSSGEDELDFDDLFLNNGNSSASTPVSATPGGKSRRKSTAVKPKQQLQQQHPDFEEDSSCSTGLLQSSEEDFADRPGPPALYRSKAYMSVKKRELARSQSSTMLSSMYSHDSGDYHDTITRFGGSSFAQAQAAKLFHQQAALMQTTGNYDWAVDEDIWPHDYLPGMLENGGKFLILMRLLDESIERGDKMLAFSQSLFTLDLLEKFLQQRECPMFAHEIESRSKLLRLLPNDLEAKQPLQWRKNDTYFRLDGSTPGTERERMINAFNEELNPARLFLLSTRAGCLGINLIGANRVVMLDVSWNPCHDCQAVCRVYRYGQKKKCFIYRLVSDNTMEKKIYDRQVTKQGMSDRVVDELNPTQQFTRAQVEKLIEYQDIDQATLTEADLKASADLMQGDPVLSLILNQFGSLWITKVPFTHESLLIDQKDYRLTKVEKRQARQHYEAEKNKGYRLAEQQEQQQQMLMMNNLQRVQNSPFRGQLGSVNMAEVKNNLMSSASSSSSATSGRPLFMPFTGGMQSGRTGSVGQPRNAEPIIRRQQTNSVDPYRFNPLIERLREEDNFNRMAQQQRQQLLHQQQQPTQRAGSKRKQEVRPNVSVASSSARSFQMSAPEFVNIPPSNNSTLTNNPNRVNNNDNLNNHRVQSNQQSNQFLQQPAEPQFPAPTPCPRCAQIYCLCSLSNNSYQLDNLTASNNLPYQNTTNNNNNRSYYNNQVIDLEEDNDLYYFDNRQHGPHQHLQQPHSSSFNTTGGYN